MTEDQESHINTTAFLYKYFHFLHLGDWNMYWKNGRFYNPPEKHLLTRFSYVFLLFVCVHIYDAMHNVIMLCYSVRTIAIALISIYNIRNRQNENPQPKLKLLFRMSGMRTVFFPVPIWIFERKRRIFVYGS